MSQHSKSGRAQSPLRRVLMYVGSSSQTAFCNDRKARRMVQLGFADDAFEVMIILEEKSKNYCLKESEEIE